jgi:glycosyltransferase involved in cell wall biosynthesis
MTVGNFDLVSICMVTFNHESFIKKAIDGVLLQKCNFEIELIISDDASTDQTEIIIRDIINTSNQGYLIKYFRQEINIGMQSNGLFVLNRVRGKYIALCDGDDYWIDPYKLQKQYDFLEGNPDYLLCAHRIKELRGDEFFSILNEKIEYKFLDFSVTGSCNGVYTSSMMFRNTPIILDVFLSDWTLNLDGGDHLILLLSTVNGHKIKLLNDVMGVYRIHNGGVWSSSTIEKKVKDAIFTNKSYIYNLNLSKIQKNQIKFGLTRLILQFYSARIKNKFLRKSISISLKIAFFTGPGFISNWLINFFSNRILSKT